MTKLVTALSLVLLLAGCSTDGNLHPLEDLQPTSASDENYSVRAGDTLMVNVWGEPKLTGEYLVRDDGKLSMPLVNDIPASGKSLDVLSKEIATKLNKFVPGASISISVTRPAPVRYYLSGAFVKPGEYRSEGSITLLQAIAAGGGFAPFADESSINLIRKGEKGDFRYELDYNRVVQGNEPNPELKSGDIIAIQQ